MQNKQASSTTVEFISTRELERLIHFVSKLAERYDSE